MFRLTDAHRAAIRVIRRIRYFVAKRKFQVSCHCVHSVNLVSNMFDGIFTVYDHQGIVEENFFHFTPGSLEKVLILHGIQYPVSLGLFKALYTSPPGRPYTSPPGRPYTSPPGRPYTSPPGRPYTSPPGRPVHYYSISLGSIRTGSQFYSGCQNSTDIATEK